MKAKVEVALELATLWTVLPHTLFRDLHSQRMTQLASTIFDIYIDIHWFSLVNSWEFPFCFQSLSIANHSQWILVWRFNSLLAVRRFYRLCLHTVKSPRYDISVSILCKASEETRFVFSTNQHALITKKETKRKGESG